MLSQAKRNSVQRQDPGNRCLEVVVADFVGGVGQHRDFAPDAGAAGADFVEEAGGGFGVAFVFGGDFLVGGADALLVYRVAGNAAGLLDDGFAGVGGAAGEQEQAEGGNAE